MIVLHLQSMWNGAIEATSAILSATVALLASRLHANFINTKTKVLAILFALSFCASAAIFLTANASHRFESYAGYLIFYMFYTFTITISRYSIYNLIFHDSFIPFDFHISFRMFRIALKLQKSCPKIAMA